MKKRMASLTLFDYYGNQQVRIADILGSKAIKLYWCVTNKNNNPLYLQLFRLPSVL